MAEPTENQSAALLEGILRTLQLINGNMLAQEKRWDRLEEVFTRHITSASQVEKPSPRPIESSSNPTNEDTVTKTQSSLVVRSGLKTRALSVGVNGSTISEAQHTPVVATVESPSQLPGNIGLQDSKSDGRSHGLPKNSGTTSHTEDSPLLNHPFVQDELGDAWMMPDDGCMPLSFSREVLEELEIDKLKALVSYLAKFRNKMARATGLHFHVTDYYGANSMIFYNLGERAVIQSPNVVSNPISPQKLGAPRRRFIFCQGLNTTQGNDDDPSRLTVSNGPLDTAPFLLQQDRCKTNEFVATPIGEHNICRQHTKHEGNNYEDYWQAFHITFYEAPSVYFPDATKELPRGFWRHGSLYGSNELNICESALTLITIPSASERSLRRPEYHRASEKYKFIAHSDPCIEWSILLLAPVGFLDQKSHSFPPKNGDLITNMGEERLEEAVIHILEAVYTRLRYNWRLFKNHFNWLLDEGDGLMNPDLHDNLLWDDETFSRSRKYAWAINCLTEFERNIEDNILQWRNFKSARLRSFLNAGTLSRATVLRVENIHRLCISLEGLQKDFSVKLASTKALRDSLFNASTVIESRASTRLGENIRLLTFVSIFFLPLAFCTSLWSVNDTFSYTALIYTTIIVGLSTYIIVFHLNSLVKQVSSIYSPIRNNLVSQMRRHSQDTWANKGTDFATFRPKHENQSPSEWWIFLFWAQKLISPLYCLLRRGSHADDPATNSPQVIVIDCDDTNTTGPVATETQVHADKTGPAVSQNTPNDSNKTLPPESQIEAISRSRTSPFSFSFLRRHKPDREPLPETATEQEIV